MTLTHPFVKLLHLALLAFLLSSLPVLGNVAKVTELVEERAMAELDQLLPSNGRIDIRLAEGVVTEGQFIQEFWMDQDTGQFIANVVTEYGETQRVWGLAIMTVSVPVPTRRMLPDEIVSRQDISLIDLPMQRLGAFAIHDEEKLVGQQVRRMLVAGRPVPRQSVIPPRIIERGDKVKIVLKHGALSLTANGRAMADAHEGQAIKVVNLSSNKSIEAIATAEGVVEVWQ